MPVLPFKDFEPQLGEEVFVAPSAYVIGNVVVGSRCGIWFSTVIRGDMDGIVIGDETNIQDNATVHVDNGEPARIGSKVTVGHNVVLHSCTVEDGVLVGMGAVILNNAVIGKNSLVAAGSLITPGTKIPARSLVMGSPGKVVRTFNDEEIPVEGGMYKKYLELAGQYRGQV